LNSPFSTMLKAFSALLSPTVLHVQISNFSSNRLPSRESRPTSRSGSNRNLPCWQQWSSSSFQRLQSSPSTICSCSPALHLGRGSSSLPPRSQMSRLLSLSSSCSKYSWCAKVNQYPQELAALKKLPIGDTSCNASIGFAPPIGESVSSKTFRS
jgi:hypothetical protein